MVTNKRNRQCTNCFAKGHSAVECKNEKVQLKDYKKALNDFIKKMTNNPDIDRNDADPQADEEEEEPAPTTTHNLEKMKTPTKKDINKKTVALPKKLPEDEKETGDEGKTSCNKDPQEENEEIWHKTGKNNEEGKRKRNSISPNGNRNKKTNSELLKTHALTKKTQLKVSDFYNALENSQGTTTEV